MKDIGHLIFTFNLNTVLYCSVRNCTVLFGLTCAPQNAVCGPPWNTFIRKMGSLKINRTPATLRLVTIMLAGVCKLRNLKQMNNHLALR